MATKFDLCSRVAIGLDANPIQSFDEETREAEVFGQIYDAVKRSELSSKFWNFNIFWYTLSQENVTPDDPRWTYQFLPPPSVLRYLEIIDSNGNPVRYQIARGRVLTTVENVIAKYMRDLDETDFPYYFQDLLVARLKAEAASALSNDNVVVRLAMDEYQMKLRIAGRIDAQDNPPVDLITDSESTWITARGGAGGMIFNT